MTAEKFAIAIEKCKLVNPPTLQEQIASIQLDLKEARAIVVQLEASLERCFASL